MTCDCQQKVGKNEGAISGCRRNSENDNGHQGKATKKEIVAAVVKLETAKTATTERQQEKELVAAVFRLATAAKGRLQEK